MNSTKILIGALLLGSTSALAQPPLVVRAGDVPFAVVSYGDLNISSKSGQDRLANRIRAAASDICLEGNREDVKFTTARRTCYRTALDSGFRQMNSAVAENARGVSTAAAVLTISGR
jgi:UrcA family protein